MANRRAEKPRLDKDEAERQLKERMRCVLYDWDTNATRIARWSKYMSEPTMASQINKSDTRVTGLGLMAMLEYVPDLSAEWLMRGVGDRKLNGVKPVHTPQKSNEGEKTSKEQSVDKKNATESPRLIEAYKERCEMLERELERANKRISLLLDRL